MDGSRSRLQTRAATIDEILSDDFVTLAGQKGDTDLAVMRLAAWCRAAASGDWLLFGRRLQRDRLSMDSVLARLATARPIVGSSTPSWAAEAGWIWDALCSELPAWRGPVVHPFGQLFERLARDAEERLRGGLDEDVFAIVTPDAFTSLRMLLLEAISGLLAPALYERFADMRRAADAASSARYDRQYHAFVAAMRGGGLARLFDERPVLLRLTCVLVRQWLDCSGRLLVRLTRDFPAIAQTLLSSGAAHVVIGISGHLSDPHQGGQSVLIVAFSSGARVVYKPKDMRIDAAWQSLVAALNQGNAPLTLRAPRCITRDHYGWAEYIEHAACADSTGFTAFFRRAGAWLALLHVFAASDMHHENIIAAGDHPIPIDLETILQAGNDDRTGCSLRETAFESARRIVADCVMAVGLLPAYARSSDSGEFFEVGGVAADASEGARLAWRDLNTDAMRPEMLAPAGASMPSTNLPHIAGRSPRLGDHIDDLIGGFVAYAGFLASPDGRTTVAAAFDDFAGLPVRKVLRPTQFYALLLQRLKNDRTMADGATWSAQADFVARLSDWDRDDDPSWPLLQAERSALLNLDVPYFVVPADGRRLSNGGDVAVYTSGPTGLDRARARLAGLNAREIAWQVDVIRQNTRFLTRSTSQDRSEGSFDLDGAGDAKAFIAEAGRIADELGRQAIRAGDGAAWIGLGWQADSNVSQLTVLGHDLYNGDTGIALFLAAHADVTDSASSAALARAGVADLRRELHGGNAARLVRLGGIGGAVGIGSIVYALTVMAKLLRDDALQADALRASELIGTDSIAADRQMDVIGGAAGAILGLLRLHRDSGMPDVLDKAIRCGEHILAQRRRLAADGARQERRTLNGMSHGAAGIALALASLAAATGRDDFAQAADECVVAENASYDPRQSNWPDIRHATPDWRSRWCHGGTGIGLARLAMARRGRTSEVLTTDVARALEGAERLWPCDVDSLCCGALGMVELSCDAGRALGRPDLVAAARRRLGAIIGAAAARGDYRWNGGEGRFNPGLFRGLSGVGYTCLRQVHATLPNILVWE